MGEFPRIERVARYSPSSSRFAILREKLTFTAMKFIGFACSRGGQGEKELFATALADWKLYLTRVWIELARLLLGFHTWAGVVRSVIRCLRSTFKTSGKYFCSSACRSEGYVVEGNVCERRKLYRLCVIESRIKWINRFRGMWKRVEIVEIFKNETSTRSCNEFLSLSQHV